jgi:hypothetical protein
LQSFIQMAENLSTGEPSNLKELEESLKVVGEAEKKLDATIHFMEKALSQQGTPHFKDFWDAKKQCLELFRENINPSIRMGLWARYSELSREARKLKEIFDEQSAFAVEQIEMAIKACEDDVKKLNALLPQFSAFAFSYHPKVLEERIEPYSKLQQELGLLNVYASKINALRKELIKTEMRIRDKNHFFARLSVLGDAIFPRRKDLIGQVSALFSEDVGKFISHTFSQELSLAELFRTKDEIKALQNAAKELTLNTEVFSNTRQQLSECWDSVAKLIDSRKREESEQKSEFREKRDQIAKEIEELNRRYSAKEIDEEKALAELDIIVSRMKTTTLGKQEIKLLRDKVNDARRVFFEKQKAEMLARKREIDQKEQSRKDTLRASEEKLDTLIETSATLELDPFMLSYEEVVRAIQDAKFFRAEKIEIDRKLRKLRDILSLKKEKKLLNLSGDDKEKITQLKLILQERKKRRQEIKRGLDDLRKTRGSSGLDFASALEADDTLKNEKERLEEVEASIEEIEGQIVDFEER